MLKKLTSNKSKINSRIIYELNEGFCDPENIKNSTLIRPISNDKIDFISSVSLGADMDAVLEIPNDDEEETQLF